MLATVINIPLAISCCSEGRAPSADMDRAVAASVVSFLQLARVLPPPAENKGGGGVLDLRAIPSTKGHRVQQ